MTEITQKLLTEEKIPIAPFNGEDFDKLNISVDGYKAQCFILERWGTNKIIIQYEEKHPKWNYCFITKYFHFEKLRLSYRGTSSLAWRCRRQRIRS